MKNIKDLTAPIIVIIIGLLILLVLSIITGSKYSNIKPVQSKQYNPNRVIKSTYDAKYNIYAVLYIENNDTVGLDWIYPYELDSLINDLNKQNK